MTNTKKIAVVLFLILFSCTGNQSEEKEKSVSIQFNDSLFLKENIIELIRNYIKENLTYNSYFISVCREEEYPYNMKGFLLGPTYKDIFEACHPIMFLNIEGKRVYLESWNESLFAKIKLPDTFFVEKNSIINEYGIEVKDVDELFIRKSIFFKVNYNNSISLDLRPDTSMIPKCVGIINLNISNIH